MDNVKAMELFAQADALYRQGRYGESLTALRCLAETFPENKTLLYAVALCLEGLEQREEAIRLCDRLVNDFHYDKAIILKARLVTKPDDVSAGSVKGFAASAWPERLDIAGNVIPVASSPAYRNSTKPYWFAGLAVCCLVVLFLVSVVFFAQAGVTMPGAAPTLFPGRLLLFFLCTALFASSVINGSCLIAHKQPLKTAVPASLYYGFLMLVPVVGWLPAVYFLRKYFGLDTEELLAIIGCILGVCFFMATSTAWVLNLNGFEDIYRELEAGYG